MIPTDLTYDIIYPDGIGYKVISAINFVSWRYKYAEDMAACVSAGELQQFHTLGLKPGPVSPWLLDVFSSTRRGNSFQHDPIPYTKACGSYL